MTRMTRTGAVLVLIFTGLVFSLQVKNGVDLPTNQASASDLTSVVATEPSRLADRLSLVLRGIPASGEEREELTKGVTTLVALSEKYRQDRRFADRLAQFWLGVLKADTPFDFGMVENADEISLLSDLQPRIRNNPTALIFRRSAGCGEPRFELFMAGQRTQQDVDNQQSRCDALAAGAEKQECENRLRNLIEDLERTNTFRDRHDCDCSTEKNFTDVSPWWKPEGTVKVCQSVVVDTICGRNLENCIPLDSRINNRRIDSFLNPLVHNANRFIDELIGGLTLEPGMLIARTIQENLDYRQILTTTKTVLPGAVETFLLSSKGRLLRTQAAGGFSNGANLIGNQSTRKAWRWIERGERNAGVLTTPQFHQATNGYRAKANRTYESFLCRQFIIPAGVTDSNPDEPDLTKRQPCASCHVDLEPMGSMFKRWPEMGTNFLYRSSLDASGGFRIHPSGAYESGVDVPDLAKMIIKDERFAECAVQRVYEFLVGRSPDEYDFTTSIPKWKDMFVKNEFKLWPVMQEIIRSVHFQGGWK